MLIKIRSFLPFIKTAAFGLILLLAGLSLLTILPARTVFKPFVVLSGSMRPSLSEGSVAIVRRGADDLKTGDVITFISPKNSREQITHRITSLSSDQGRIYYQTKGDANSAEDLEPVPREAVWGKLVFSLPYLGHLISFVKTRWGVVLIIVLPLLIIALDELRIIYREIDKMRKKNQGKSAPLKIGMAALVFYFGIILFRPADTLALFSNSVSVGENQIDSACWTNPDAPVLISPAENSVANSAGLAFSWQTAASTCPNPDMKYMLDVFDDPLFDPARRVYGPDDFIAGTSYTVSDIAEGTYYWLVRAKNKYGHESPDSVVFKVTVDRTAPPAPGLTITGSYTKDTDETVGNGGFESGLSGWANSGDASALSEDIVNNTAAAASETVEPKAGEKMIRLGKPGAGDNPDETGNFLWENRVSQSLPAKAKTLSLYYNFFSRDLSPFDDPGMAVKLNGALIYARKSGDVNPDDDDQGKARSTGWQQFIYDLSSFDGQVNLTLYAGNDYIDKTYQSWAYFDGLSTKYVAAPGHAEYHFAGIDNEQGSGIDYYEYKLFNKSDSEPADWTTGSQFKINSGGGYYLLKYRSADKAGNRSLAGEIEIFVDQTPPSPVGDLTAQTAASSAVLSWTAPGNDENSGRASRYDLRFSKNPINADNFLSADKSPDLPPPQTAGKAESYILTGLDPGAVYYFALKSADEAPNWSAVSNTASGATLPGSDVNPGDIVINELMWMGTSASPYDEFLELRNMTGREISLSGLKLKHRNGGGLIDMNINFSGQKILSHGYYLITNFNPSGSGSKIKDTVIPDLIDSSLVLSNTNLEILLEDGAGNVIDSAWDGSVPTEGFHDDSSDSKRHYSVERVSSPGDGADPLNWYTCIDSASNGDFFKAGSDERGTPGAKNRSENEPFNRFLHSIRLVTPPPSLPADMSAGDGPSVELKLISELKSLEFTVRNASNYLILSYSLNYGTDGQKQGVAGSLPIENRNIIAKQILLGTCSAGGECVYHQGVNNINLKVILENDRGENAVINKVLLESD